MIKTRLPRGFEERLLLHEKQLKEQEFYILVWGSGEAGGFAYNKRIRIRDHLAKSFGRENVMMSEDTDFLPYADAYGNLVAEGLQAQSVDVIVILNTSIGPHTELLKFEEILLGKTIVFVPYEHKEAASFASTAYDVLKVEGYTSEEIESCDNIRRKANRFAQALRFRKLHHVRLTNLFGSQDSPFREPLN